MSILSKIDEYVKLPEWLQMVGVVLCFGGLMASSGGGRWVGFIGLGIAVAGRLYKAVYP